MGAVHDATSRTPWKSLSHADTLAPGLASAHEAVAMVSTATIQAFHEQRVLLSIRCHGASLFLRFLLGCLNRIPSIRMECQVVFEFTTGFESATRGLSVLASGAVPDPLAFDRRRETG